MLKKPIRQHGHKRRHVKEIHFVSMDTNEGMLKKSIRQYVHKRKHVKEINTSAWTQKKAC